MRFTALPAMPALWRRLKNNKALKGVPKLKAVLFAFGKISAVPVLNRYGARRFAFTAVRCFGLGSKNPPP